MKTLVLTALLIVQSESTVPTATCRLTVQTAIGCLGTEISDAPENAADLFQAYGLDPKKIQAPATLGYVQRFNCMRLSDGTGDLGLKSIGAMQIAEKDGPVVVRYVQISKDKMKRIIWIADPYLVGKCPPLHPLARE